MSKNFSLSDNLYNPTKQYLNTIKNDTIEIVTVKYLKFSLSNTLDNTKNNKFIINKDKIFPLFLATDMLLRKLLVDLTVNIQLHKKQMLKMKVFQKIHLTS